VDVAYPVAGRLVINVTGIEIDLDVLIALKLSS